MDGDAKIAVLYKLSHIWFCGRKTTNFPQRKREESDDLAGFHAFHSVSAVLSSMSEHL